MTTLHLLTIAAPICGFFGVLAWRIRETKSAVTLTKIVAPPLGMASGLCMFIVPAFRVPWTWALAAFIIGAALLAYPLLRTSRLIIHPESRTITIQRSPAFLFVLVALAIVRFAAKSWIGNYLSLRQTAGLFFLLAFGMIVRWRLSMLREYKSLTNS